MNALGLLAAESASEPWWIALISAIVIVNILLLLFAYLTLIERKFMGRMQLRYGPNRACPFGLLQPIADLVKLVRKEAFSPSSAIELPYILAPVISAFTAIAAFSFIPFGPGWTVNGWHINGEVANVSIGLIAIFALGSIGIYGFIVGGWASESKYSLLGSMRTCAQLVSYEVSLALSVLGVVILGRSLNLQEIVAAQHSYVPYAIPQFVGMVIFFIAGTAETSRAPFDLPEAESELVAGLPHGVFGDALGPLPNGRVHQPHHALGPARDAVPRRLARAVAARAALVPPQDDGGAHGVHLDTYNAAAPALRPTDALRLEGSSCRLRRSTPS